MEVIALILLFCIAMILFGILNGIVDIGDNLEKMIACINVQNELIAESNLAENPLSQVINYVSELKNKTPARKPQSGNPIKLENSTNLEGIQDAKAEQNQRQEECSENSGNS